MDAAKAELTSTGSIQPKIIAKKDGKVTIMLLEFPNSDGKELSKKIVKGKLKQMQPDEYYFISEAWVSTAKDDRLYRQPVRDIDRKEAIIVMKYKKELKECKVAHSMFTKEGEKFIFEDLPDSIQYSGSAWDIWHEIDTRHVIKEHNEKVIKKWAKEIKEEMWPEMDAAKTIEEKKAILLKTIHKCKEKHKEHMKSLLEDTEKTEEI